MLLGWILRTFGPDFRYRLAEDDGPPGGDFLLARLSWRRFTGGLGALVSTAGIVIVFFTFVLILVNPSTDIGTWVELALFALTLVAAAVWSWMYVGRYGTFGILPEPKQEDRAFRTEPAPEDEDTGLEPEPFIGPVAQETGFTPTAPQDEMVFAEEYDDIDPAESFDEDEHAERRIRMSRYQSHGPDGRDEVQHEVESAPGAQEEPVDEGEPAVYESAQADGGPEEIEDEPGNHDDDEIDDGPDAPDGTEPAARIAEDVRDDTSGLDGTEGENIEPGEDEPDDLDDTPERRAEALRRIQEWNPDDSGKT